MDSRNLSEHRNLEFVLQRAGVVDRSIHELAPTPRADPSMKPSATVMRKSFTC
jgi:hypothetical protein